MTDIEKASLPYREFNKRHTIQEFDNWLRSFSEGQTFTLFKDNGHMMLRADGMDCLRFYLVSDD